MHIKDHDCPKCGRDTLEHQSGVIWCDRTECDFGGYRDGEKTLDDLQKPAASAAA